MEIVNTLTGEKKLNFTIAVVRAELESAQAKFADFRTAHEGASIIREELEEMWDEVKANNLTGTRHECIQLAAMAIRFLLDVTVPQQFENRRES